jgi:tRNA(Ile)-lysidine synthase
MFIKEVQTAIQTHALIPHGSRVLVGVSGGADSIALLHALRELTVKLDFQLAAAHLNHAIRPEAGGDADFVQAVCDSIGVDCVIQTEDVPALADATGTSLEMAARDARYRFFARSAAAVEADRVATAHTLDDQAETVLLRLCRGAGAAGLDGISRDTTLEGVRVIRPMLDISRAAVEQYLQEQRFRWREDATNADTDYRRNRIRHEVLPLLERHLNPKVKEALARSASILAEENTFIEALAEARLEDAMGDDGELNIERIQACPPALQRRMLHLWLIRMGVPTEALRYETVTRIATLSADARGSGAISLPGGRAVRREYEHLCFVPEAEDIVTIPETVLAVPGTTDIPGTNLRVTTSLQSGFSREQTGPVGRIPAQAAIRWDVASAPEIRVRSWQAGDRIHPLGMQGSCKIQDLFVDAKIPRHARVRIPIFVIDNEIVWLPGYRIAQSRAVAARNDCSLLLRVHIR